MKLLKKWLHCLPSMIEILLSIILKQMVLQKKINQTLVWILKTIVMNSKYNWALKFILLCWAYWTTYRVLTKAISFSLVYRIEVILVIEFVVPSLHVAIDNRLDTF